MNKALDRLFKIANKKEHRILGLMSGTSLDGLDIVLCTINDISIKQEEFKTISYSPNLKSKLENTRSRESVSLSEICYLNTEMAHLFADEVNHALKEWGIANDDIDLIGCHGQTIFHNPEATPKNTLQIVDGDHIAQKTGILTISDFRQKHVAAGGEGAPLANYLDEFLFEDEHRIRVALNLGGIANFTIIPPKHNEHQVISTDIGPANTLMNEAMIKYFNKPYDEDGRISSTGTAHSGLVKYLLLDPFFRKPYPKSTGQELFNLQWVEDLMESHQITLSTVDLISSLTELTVKSVSRGIEDLLSDKEFDLIVSGGGIHNSELMTRLKKELSNADFLSIEGFGITADAKESVLMAFLAHNLLKEKGVSVQDSEVHLGKISFPN